MAQPETSKPRQPNSASFFDDEDATKKFEFKHAEKGKLPSEFKHPPMNYHYFTMKNLATNQTTQSWFSLYDKYIAQCTKTGANLEVQNYLSINWAILSPKITLPGDKYSFNITKNKVTFDFVSEDEAAIDDWLTSIRSKIMCVHYNFHEDYKAIKMIGKGSFARVYLSEQKLTQVQFAVKAFNKEYLTYSTKNSAKPCLLNEIQIMRELKHDSIIQMHDVYETENSIYLVLELIEGKTLEEILKKATKYNEAKYKTMIKSILEALSYLSSKKIMHRDLKPDNILVDKDDNVKVVDFGLATFIDEKDYIFQKCGTPGYIAPEVFKYEANKPETFYNDKCDVFSAGCIFFYMLFGTQFFNGTDASEILSNNKTYRCNNIAINMVYNEYNNPNGKISKDALKFLMNLLEHDPKKRVTASLSLTHQFLTPKLNPLAFKKNYTDQDIRQIQAFAPKDPSKQTADSKTGEAGDGSKKSVTSNADGLQIPNKPLQKESFYNDIGPGLINGKVNTMNVQSNINSIGVSNHLAQKANDMTTLSRRNTEKNLLKAALMNNVHKGDFEKFEEEKKSNVPIRNDRRVSSQLAFHDAVQEVAAESTGIDDDDESEVISSEDSRVEKNIIKMKNNVKNPSKDNHQMVKS